MKKRVLALLLSATLILGTGITAFAADETSGSEDVLVSEDTVELDVFEDEYSYLEEEALSVVEQAVEEDVVDAEEAGEKTQQQLIDETYAEVLSGATVTYDDASDIARLVQMGYSKVQNQGPISITKGTLTTKGIFGIKKKKDIYVVCFSGTDTDAENQSTGWWTDLLVGFEQDNRYIQNIRTAVTNNIPKGSNILFAGHSLGGMVAQQAASDSTIKNNYNVLYTVTFGSPLINGFKREGTVKRLGDTVDPVPYLSVSTFLNIIWQSAGLNRENGGYGTKIITAHCESYQRESVWGAYDVTGTKNGGATVTLDLSTLSFYKSPVTVTD